MLGTKKFPKSCFRSGPKLDDLSNYRPDRLTGIPGKIIESLIQDLLQ